MLGQYTYFNRKTQLQHTSWILYGIRIPVSYKRRVREHNGDDLSPVKRSYPVMLSPTHRHFFNESDTVFFIFPWVMITIGVQLP